MKAHVDLPLEFFVRSLKTKAKRKIKVKNPNPNPNPTHSWVAEKGVSSSEFCLSFLLKISMVDLELLT